MAGIWRIIGKGVDDSPPTISEFLHLSNANIQRINFLTSNELSHGEEPLNPNQCRSLSSKLVRTLENIGGLFFSWDQGSTSAASTLSTRAFENFYLVTERAKELVEGCCNEDWCRASAFQIQNEEAFKDILLETSLCYSAIYELIKDKVPYQDLRQTPTFEPPPLAEVKEDQQALLRRYQDFVDQDYNLDSLVQKQHLVKHLLRRLKCVISQSEDFDVTIAGSWSRGDEWGVILEHLGRSVWKTTWLGVPCAKKVFEDGVEEELILKEARILALVNHPNIVKFISCGHDRDNTWLFIAMEHMETSLHSVIKKRSQARKGAPFPIHSAVHIMMQIAYGTCYLHDAGVAHRDFKTSNVAVSQFSSSHLQDYFHVKLVDFGLSKVKLSASRSNTISRPRIGTTVYMPPEAFHHGRANWSKADVYSFGIMCSVILSGNEPFPITKFQRTEVYEAICSGVRPMLPMETPEDLACLIKECWDADRNVRPNFIEICTRLAKIRHRLLKEDADGCQLNNDLDGSTSLYIQDRITKLSNARKQDYKQLLENVTEEDEWFIPDEEFGFEITYDHERPRLNESHGLGMASHSTERPTSPVQQPRTGMYESGMSSPRYASGIRGNDAPDDQGAQTDRVPHDSINSRPSEGFDDFDEPEVSFDGSQTPVHSKPGTGNSEPVRSPPQLPPSMEEPASPSFDENNRLPEIEGLRIVGDPILGGRLTACGHPVNGTVLCIFQWIRHYHDGSANYIEGANYPEYVITADDCDNKVAVECVPTDERNRRGKLVKIMVNEGNWIKPDLMMQDQIEAYMTNNVQPLFEVTLLEGTLEDASDIATLILRRNTYELRRNNGRKMLINEKYSSQVSINIPAGEYPQCYIICHDKREIYLELRDSRTRDLAVLTFRAFLKAAMDEQKKKPRRKWHWGSVTF